MTATAPPPTLLQICASCAHEFRAPSRLIGRNALCPHCQAPMAITDVSPKANGDRLVGKEIGGCLLARRMGAGALGVVYEAEQHATSRRVAIKLLSSRAAVDAEVVARFQREARLCAEIRHPHVVEVYDCGFERGVHFLVMELIDGPTLAGLIEEAMPWREAAGFMLQIARALAEVHRLGIIHRDIKPANILIGVDGQAKLADLGLAKRIDTEGGAGLGLTLQGMALGSPAYMPPEQIRNARDVSVTADIYALGATFYQAVTGELPFAGRNGTEVMTKVLGEPPRPVAELADDVPRAVATLIHRCMAKDPARRPQDATALITALEDILAGRVDISSRPAVLRPLTGILRRRPGGRAWIIVAVVVIVGVLALAAWLLSSLPTAVDAPR